MQQLSVSRMNCMLGCNRHHYWRYEVGLEPVEKAVALRFGSAIHRGLAARATGLSYEDSLSAAYGEVQELDALQSAIVATLLAGYFLVYQKDIVKEMYPEIERKVLLPYNRHFMGICVLDGLGLLEDGRKALIEHKTTSESLESSSNYWETLRYNAQVLAYVDSIIGTPWECDTIIYDVIRKPSIQPRMMAKEDENGIKIVLGPDGQRVYKKDGTPRESGDSAKGYVVQEEMETIEQYRERLMADIMERKEFYYARREVTVLHSELEEFRGMRDAVARQIVNCRKEQSRYEKPEFAWPRCVGRFNCQSCDCASFCLQGISASAENVPVGMQIKQETREVQNG